MDKGLWVWPAEPRAQRRTIAKVADSPHLVGSMKAIAKSKEGLSNSELDEVIGDNSEWMTLWTIRQLTSLGLIEFKVDFFGGPARYQLTELGRTVLSTISGAPAQPKPPAPAPSVPTPTVAAPKPA